MKKLMMLILILLFCSGSFVFAQDDDDEMDISLADLLNMEVGVASKTKTTAAESPGVVYVFSRRDIDLLGAKTLGDLLNLVPGFDVMRSVRINDHYSIGVRGKASMYSEAVLILVDGVRQTDVVYGSPVVISRYYNLYNVEKIEIIRGPGSALYGAGAFVGVVSIITRSGKDNQSFMANYEGGSFGTHSAWLYKGLEMGNLSFSAALQGNTEKGEEYEDLITKFGRPVAETQDPVDDYEINVKINYDTDSINGEFGIKTLSRISQDYIPDGWRNTKVNGVDNVTKSNLHSAFGKLGIPFLDQGNLNLTLSMIDNYSENYYQLFAPEELPPGNANALSGRGGLAGPFVETITSNAEAQVQWNFSDTHTLISGISYQIDDPKNHWGWGNMDLAQLFPPGLFTPVPEYTKYNSSSGDKRNILGVFMQDTFKVFDKLSPTVGVRYDSYNDVGTTVNPRIALVYVPDKATSLKLLAATAFRAPSYAELYHHNNPSSVGNPDLKPEKISTLEFYAQRTFKERFLLSGNIYHSRIKDFITTISSPGSIAVFENHGEHVNTGFETEAKYIHDLRNMFTLNYGYSNPKDGDTDEELHHVAKHSINVVANVGLGERFDFALYGFYRSERIRVEGDTRENIDSYFIANAKASAKIIDNLKIYIRGTNLLNTEYYGPEAADLCVGDAPNRGLGVFFGIHGTY